MPERAKKRVLILCTGNSCRSQMAEGWLRQELGDFIEVHSAGTSPCFVHPMSIRVMAELGIDISNHWSKSVKEFREQEFDLVVTVCDSARQACPVLLGAAKTLHEPIPDPYELADSPDAVDAYRKARDLIRDRIIPLVTKELCLDR